MYTIIDAAVQAGWHADDHMRNHDVANDLIGLEYATLRSALRSIRRAEEEPRAWPITAHIRSTEGIEWERRWVGVGHEQIVTC